jgi:hypothetical protein
VKNPSGDDARKIPPLLGPRPAWLTDEQLADMRRRWDAMSIGVPPRPGLALRVFAAINRVKRWNRRRRRRRFS